MKCVGANTDLFALKVWVKNIGLLCSHILKQFIFIPGKQRGHNLWFTGNNLLCFYTVSNSVPVSDRLCVGQRG